jgi:hypothetical protein
MDADKAQKTGGAGSSIRATNECAGTFRGFTATQPAGCPTRPAAGSSKEAEICLYEAIAGLRKLDGLFIRGIGPFI